MNKKVMILVMSLLLLAAVAPVMASQPKLSYTYGGIMYGDPTNPGTSFTSAEKILHSLNKTAIGFTYGTPWGDGTAMSTKGYHSISLEDYTGSGIGRTLDTFATGTLEGIITIKFNGVGWYIYDGPTFTYDSVTVTSGDMFFGVLFSGTAVKHGASGDLLGIKLQGSYTAVIPVIGPEPLLFKNVVSETGTYMFTG